MYRGSAVEDAKAENMKENSNIAAVKKTILIPHPT